MHVCMYVCMYLRPYVCMYIRPYKLFTHYIYIYVCMHIHIYNMYVYLHMYTPHVCIYVVVQVPYAIQAWRSNAAGYADALLFVFQVWKRV